MQGQVDAGRRRRQSGVGAAWAIAGALMLLMGCSGGEDVLAAEAGQLAALPDGRKINLRCSGQGSPVVLFETGFGGDSGAWYKVAPTVAKTTRVCTYDRAGYGFSDPGPAPRDGAAIARDLDQALRSAKISGPFIVVGHSAGGLYGRLFAARRPADVLGLILLDPTVERRAPQPAGDGLDGIRSRLTRCVALTASGPPTEDALRSGGCLAGKPDAQALLVAGRAATWTGQLSELDAIYGRTSDQVFRIGTVLRDIPGYVITASDTATATLMTQFGGAPVSFMEMQHQRIAGAFLLGSQRTVLSSHMVMMDRPDVVISATLEMVDAVRANRPPAPLAPSERAPESAADAPASPRGY